MLQQTHELPCLRCGTIGCCSFRNKRAWHFLVPRSGNLHTNRPVGIRSDILKNIPGSWLGARAPSSSGSWTIGSGYPKRTSHGMPPPPYLYMQGGGPLFNKRNACRELHIGVERPGALASAAKAASL